MRIVVNREKWLRGDTESYLVRGRDQKMCCLGFALSQAGISEGHMINKTTPSRLTFYSDSILRPQDLPTYLVDAIGNDTEFCTRAMVINDNRQVSEGEREDQLTAAFREVGIDIIFVNDEIDFAYHLKLSTELPAETDARRI